MGAALKSNLDQLQSHADEVAQILSSLSHPQRLILLCSMSEGEATVSQLLEICELSQSHLSQILARLKAEGIVTSRKEGRLIYYRLKDDRIKNLIKSLQKIFCSI